MTRRPIIVTITAIIAVGMLVGFAYAAGRNTGATAYRHSGMSRTYVVARGAHTAGRGTPTQARTWMSRNARPRCCDGATYGQGWHQGRRHHRWMGGGDPAVSGTATQPHTGGRTGGAPGRRSTGRGAQDHRHTNRYHGDHLDRGWDHDCW